MRTEIEVKKMLKRSLDSDGLVSPTAIDTLEWVLEMRSNYDHVWIGLDKKKMILYNPFPAARWVRNSLIYLSKNHDDKFLDEFLFVVPEMKWSKIPYEL